MPYYKEETRARCHLRGVLVVYTFPGFKIVGLTCAFLFLLEILVFLGFLAQVFGGHPADAGERPGGGLEAGHGARAGRPQPGACAIQHGAPRRKRPEHQWTLCVPP